MFIPKTVISSYVNEFKIQGLTVIPNTKPYDNIDLASAPLPIAGIEQNETIDLATSSETIISYVNQTDRKTLYSFDEGATWTPLTEKEYETMFPTRDVKWWTYEEDKIWLDNEKEALQNIIGEKGYNPTEGWYVWTKERVEETIKIYEETLQYIKNGTMVSKLKLYLRKVPLIPKRQKTVLGILVLQRPA